MKMKTITMWISFTPLASPPRPEGKKPSIVIVIGRKKTSGMNIWNINEDCGRKKGSLCGNCSAA